ncbi:MFS transporter [Salinicola sp. MIT1003]|uniref:MFS transporter n=1 Tax=Salinicola sp. MIT1003 TaxID=1882734 RepID=UPI0008DE3873|nr:MFS transporter [Salinicola sp. MIT1003]OHZ01628.1 hypothetical protein BC443_11410 [Salinicola sp. MIT1003]
MLKKLPGCQQRITPVSDLIIRDPTTRDSGEKGQLNSYRAIGRSIGTIIVGALTLPLARYLGDGDLSTGFPVVMGVYSIIGIVLFWLVFKNCHERTSVPAAATHKGSIVSDIKKMVTNRYWLIIALNSVVWFARQGVMNGVLIYYVKYVLGEPQSVYIYITILNVANLAGGVLALTLLKRYSSRNSSILMYMLAIVFLALAYFSGGGQHVYAFGFAFFMASFMIGFGDPANLTMLGDVIDYHEWKHKKESQGTLYSGYSFALKFGSAIGAAFVGYFLGLAGYDPEMITPQVKDAITTLLFIIPIALTVVQIIILYSYRLEKQHPEIVSGSA